MPRTLDTQPLAEPRKVADDERARLTLGDYIISDQASFDRVTGQGHEIAGLYGLSQLDVLVDLARLVAGDFFARPELYKEFDDAGDDPPLVTAVAQLHARYGADERLPDHEQRAALFAPMFDDEAGDFVKYRDALLSDAATFSKWGQSTGIPMLYEAARTSHRPFREHLTRFTGVSLRYSRTTILPYVTQRVSYRMLREQGISAVFTVRQPPRLAWPYVEDAMGDQLVEEISWRLGGDGMPTLSRSAFSRRQRTALRGAEAIAAVLDYAPHDQDERDLDVLITRCYSWYAALQGVTGPGFGKMVSAAPAPSAMTAAASDGDGDPRRMDVQLFQR